MKKQNINDLLDYTKEVRKTEVEWHICPSLPHVFSSSIVERGGTPINYTCKTGARGSRQILPAKVASDQEAQGSNLLGQTVFTAKRMETDTLNKSKWLSCPQGPWCCAASPLSPLPLQYLTKLTCPKHDPSPQSCFSYLMTSTPLPPA